MRTEDPEPRKGSGYFTKRLKEKGISSEPAKPGESEHEGSADHAAAKAGQIFEESTKSIATMAGDVSETAKLVSSMKEGLERVTKIAGTFSDNPLCDSAESCSFDGVEFTPDAASSDKIKENDAFDSSYLPTRTHEEDVGEMVSYSSGEIAGLTTEADTIREGLQEFRDAVSRKESELLEFREKLNQAKLQVGGLEEQGFPDTTVPPYGSEQDLQQIEQGFSEFDSVTSTDSNMGFESVPEDPSTVQKEKDEERKLLNLRWKIKKMEAEYEKKMAQADSLEDLTAEVDKMEAKRDQLKIQIGKLEEQQRESGSILNELEQKIELAKRQSEEKGTGQQQVNDTRAVLEYLKLDKDGLKAELEQLRAKVKEAERTLEEKKAANDTLEDVRFTVSTLKAEKITLDAEIGQMRDRIKKTELEIEEKRLEKEKMGELKSVLTHLKIEKESLEDELSNLKSKIKRAESEYQQKKQAADELYEVREILAYLKPEREHLRSELSQIRAKIESLEQHQDEIAAKRHKAQAEYDELELKVNRMKSEYEQKGLSRLS